MKLWVDPPSGWMYGFPAVWDDSEYPDIEVFLAFKGYPEDDIDFAMRHMRRWPVDPQVEETPYEKECKHKWVLFNDGDYGSYFYCKYCGLRQE